MKNLIGTFNFTCGIKASRDLSRIGLFIKTQGSKQMVYRRQVGQIKEESCQDGHGKPDVKGNQPLVSAGRSNWGQWQVL